MGDKKQLEKASGVGDPELDELLNSALEDFSKKPEEVAAAVSKSDEKKEEATGDDGKPEAEWSEEFIKQTAAQFETNMASLFGNIPGNENVEVTPEQIQQNFQRMAEAAAQVMSNPTALQPTTQSNDFASTISQTLQNLSLGAENLQNPFSEQDIMNMFGGGGGETGGAGNEQNAFLPFMQGMMQSLLSKEVLYPSLKDILDKFPGWLDENKSKLDAAELERYTKQKDLMNEVCTELEAEQESDSDAMKRERFDKVLNLMQNMQNLGHPPAELVGDTGPGLQFDAQGNPMLPQDLNMTDPNQCTCM
ncbi:Peroxin 19 [Carabus blaptoides fortunei]